MEKLIDYLNNDMGVKDIIELKEGSKFIDIFNNLDNICKLEVELSNLKNELIAINNDYSYCKDPAGLEKRIPAQEKVINNMRFIKNKGFNTVYDYITDNKK